MRNCAGRGPSFFHLRRGALHQSNIFFKPAVRWWHAFRPCLPHLPGEKRNQMGCIVNGRGRVPFARTGSLCALAKNAAEPMYKRRIFLRGGIVGRRLDGGRRAFAVVLYACTYIPTYHANGGATDYTAARAP